MTAPGVFRPSLAFRAAELSAAVTVGAAKMPNPSFPLGLPPPPSGGRGNPDAKDGKLANASKLHLNRQPRPNCHSGNSRSPESLIESRGGDER